MKYKLGDCDLYGTPIPNCLKISTDCGIVHLDRVLAVSQLSIL